MLSLLTASILAVTSFAQLPQTNQLSELVKDMASTTGLVGPAGMVDCDSCYVGMCDNEIQLPTDMDCGDLNDIVEYLKMSLFKESSDCQEKGAEYVCNVYVKPFEKLTDHYCKDDVLDEKKELAAYEESFCQANEHCEDLSRCVWMNIDCEYDSDILPFIGESTAPFDESECPHNDLDERVKRFFEDYWPDMVISGVMDALLLALIIIMLMCCCRPRTRLVHEDSVV
jgi:hypothetical protein